MHPQNQNIMTQEQDIKNAIEAMRKGGVILYPTDTVWGIGCDATNAEAVKRVYEIKQRDDSKALICLVDSDARLQRYVRNVPDVAWQLIDCVEKPTTLILDGAVNLAPNLIAEDGSIGIRITKEAFSHELCFRFQKAIVSTSANISGEPAAQNYRDIDPRILEQVDYVCWTRRQEHQPHQPSSIIKLSADASAPSALQHYQTVGRRTGGDYQKVKKIKTRFHFGGESLFIVIVFVSSSSLYDDLSSS